MEVVYRWEDGREEVRYRRVDGSPEAAELQRQVDELHADAKAGGWESPYFTREGGES